MGCDIHMYIEYKLGDGPWTLDSGHKVEREGNYRRLTDADASRRNYDLFGKLADVRTPGPQPRGIPKDASELIKEFAKEDEEHSDWHSHSWHALQDFKKVLFSIKQYYSLNDLHNAEPIAFSENYIERLGYINLIAYAEKKVNEYKADLEAEKMLLGQDINTNVECRFVYWFDN